MIDAEVTVTALFAVSPDGWDAFRAAGAAVTRITRTEEGCLTYDLFREEGLPGAFMFYEVWRSERELADHLSSRHVAEFLAIVEPLLERDIRVRRWRLSGARAS